MTLSKSVQYISMQAEHTVDVPLYVREAQRLQQQIHEAKLLEIVQYLELDPASKEESQDFGYQDPHNEEQIYRLLDILHKITLRLEAETRKR